jgi:serine/threonine protein phosphatase PrpC
MHLSHTADRTDIGRQRDHNEDAHLVLAELGLLAVADGMGGLEHGEVASSTAIGTLRAATSILEEFVGRVDADPSRAGRAALGSALEQISEVASTRIQQAVKGANSGTTLVVGVVAGGHLLVANTGDSRAYLYRQGRARCLTDDHTVAAARLRAGLISQEEHDRSPYQHMLYQALGTAGEVDPDLFDEPLAAGDIVLLCSDGLTGPVSPEELDALLGSEDDLELLAQSLVDRANANGGPDNITVCLTRIDEGPSPEELEKDRLTFKQAIVTSALESADLRMVRHFFDFRVLAEGEVLDLDEGMHLLLSGMVQQGERSFGPGQALGIGGLVTELEQPGAQVTSAGASLWMSSDSYEQLERRRPRTAARLARGLLKELATSAR